MTEPPSTVFLSYASQDAEAAQRICDALREAGVEVWFDRSELRGGDVWDQSIRQKIGDCALFLPLISANTNARSEGYFRLEWKLAVDRSYLMAAEKPFLLPVIVDGTLDIDALVPDKFREVQWTRLPDGKTSTAFAQRVSHLLSPGTRIIPILARSPAGILPRGLRFLRSGIALTGIVVAVVLLGGYFAAERFVLSNGAAGARTPSVSSHEPSPPPFTPPAHSVAVLPFTNLSGDPKQEYFSDGVSEEMINALAHIDALQVSARTSSFSFKNKDTDIGTIARKLNVAAILEGSVRRSGNTVRITAQLINTANGYHIWSQDYDRDLKDILVLQADVARSIARQLQAKLLIDEPAKIQAGGTHNADAYDAVLRGRHFMTIVGSEAVRETALRSALTAFDQAAALDPNYADAYAGRAHALVNIMLSSKDFAIRESMREDARLAAERAVALAPDEAEVHQSLWYVRAVGFLDFAAAMPEIERALALEPGSASVQEAFAMQSSWLGHADVAIQAQRQAIRLDPENYLVRLNLAGILINARHFEEAFTAAQDAKAVNPEGRRTGALIAEVYLALGKAQMAQQYCEASSTLLKESDRQLCLALAYHALGRLPEAEAELASYEASYGESAAYDYAAICAQWGNRQQALDWLGTAERRHDPGFQHLRVDWMLDPIRSEPRFKALERRFNFPP
jgi:TolB-like protein/predicted Zn-dependent protease